MVTGQKTVGVHTISGMQFLVLQHRFDFINYLFVYICSHSIFCLLENQSCYWSPASMSISSFF